MAIIVPKCNYSDGHVAFIPLFGIFGAVTALSGGEVLLNRAQFGFAPVRLFIIFAVDFETEIRKE